MCPPAVPVIRNALAALLAAVALSCATVLAGPPLQAATSVKEAQIKAAFLYNFTKFVEWPEYGRNKSGRIGLQDHGDWVAYRGIRIRELK